jgi:hypothetical protein
VPFRICIMLVVLMRIDPILTETTTGRGQSKIIITNMLFLNLTPEMRSNMDKCNLLITGTCAVKIYKNMYQGEVESSW